MTSPQVASRRRFPAYLPLHRWLARGRPWGHWAAGRLLPGGKRVAVVLACDAVAAAASVVMALLLRLGDDALRPQYAEMITVATLSFVGIAVPVFYTSRLHEGSWRCASIDDLIRIIKAVTLAIGLFLPVMLVLHAMAGMPRSLPAIQWCVLVLLLGGARLAYRCFQFHWPVRAVGRRAPRPIPVLLLGTGAEAQLFLRALEASYPPNYQVVGILDEGDHMIGRSILGVPVLGRSTELAAVMARLARRGCRPDRLVLAGVVGQSEARSRLFEQAHRFGLGLARLPRLTALKDATTSRIEVEPIALEDLLGRPQVRLDRAAIAHLITGRRVLVTGAGGSIGSELVRQIAAFRPAQLVLVDHGEFNLYQIDSGLRENATSIPTVARLCDVRDEERVQRLFDRFRPEIVFHAAALKHVPMVEHNPCEGVLTNAIGTQYVADAACDHGALAVVLISTDKAVRPISIMGATKRLAEMYCQSLDLTPAASNGRGTRFITVRFGNVLGSSGSVVPAFQQQLALGGPLTVTHPAVTRYFMTVRESVELVLQASAHGLACPQDDRGKIFVLDMGEPVRIVDIARQIIRLAGLEPERDVEIVFTGLRPGEKLHEELFDRQEEPAATAAAGVLMAGATPVGLPLLRTRLDQLKAAAGRDDAATVRRLLGDAIGHHLPGPSPWVRGSDPEEPLTDEGRPLPRPVLPAPAAAASWQ